MGKTNVLDAIYYLSFTKSAFNSLDSANIKHNEDMAMIKGLYAGEEEIEISCGLKRGVKKQFRRGTKDYKRLLDHIGLIPLVMVSPKDSELVAEGSDERRRFMDSVICQYDRQYLEHLQTYSGLVKQRNAMLKEESAEDELFGIIEMQMASHAEYIYAKRNAFIEVFIPYFQEFYEFISEKKETVTLRYVSQLQNRNLQESLCKTRARDLILGWTSQGVHKDELEMMLGDYPLKQVGSQGQQKTYLIALKLAQAAFLEQVTISRKQCEKPILLLDDIFDKLDAERVEKIVELVNGDKFGQIFITDTDRQHLVELLKPINHQAMIYKVENGNIEQI